MELTLGLAIGLAAGFAACWYFVGRRRGAELTDARMRLAAAPPGRRSGWGERARPLVA